LHVLKFRNFTTSW